VKYVIVVLVLLSSLSAGFYVYSHKNVGWIENLSPGGKRIQKVLEGPLSKYDFDSLKKRGGIASTIKVEGETKDVDIRRINAVKATLPKKKQKQAETIMRNAMTWKSNVISFESNGKKITGMMNVPLTPKSNKMPALIMIRGFADNEGYYTGSGSWKAADYFAQQGFVTVSLDFLGFGGSDYESRDILEARFEKVMSVMDLVESVKNLDFVDPNRIGIWAHSNGGQIALSVLEVTGTNLPTTLWAPMTNPFPQSVLDTAGDDPAGQKVKQTIADFEKKYDSRRYAFENYYQWISAPIMIHQGTADVWCKMEWQEDVVNHLRNLNNEATLYKYVEDDHNLKNNWDMVVGRDVQFFTRTLVQN
jgi:dipeptidyl aminopeptidase/acylaminoacyl peptidase